MPDPKAIKAAAKAAAAAAEADLPALTAAAEATKADADKAAAARRAAQAVETVADEAFFVARRRQHNARARIEVAEALIRLIVKPDWGAELIGALRAMRAGHHIEVGVRDMLVRRHLVTKPDRWTRCGLTSLGRDVLAMYDEITATPIPTTEDR